MLVTVGLSLLSVLLQVPDECAEVRSVHPRPFCFAATFAVNIGSMAEAYQREGDSVPAASASGSLENAVRTIVYWNLERRRVARRACSELSSFQVTGDSTAALLVETFCAVTKAMIHSDSSSVADVLADLKDSKRRTAVDRATTQANRRQHAEELNRTLVTASMLLTFVLVRTDPTTGRTGQLALRREQHRWLVDRLRAASPRNADSGVFGQAASELADWLTESDWKLLPE